MIEIILYSLLAAIIGYVVGRQVAWVRWKEERTVALDDGNRSKREDLL